MHGNVEVITDLAPDQLSRQRWEFSLDDLGIVRVDSWTDEERPSRRHKWRVVQAYRRLPRIYEDIERKRLVNDPPLITVGVGRQAAFALLSRMRFSKSGQCLASLLMVDQ